MRLGRWQLVIRGIAIALAAFALGVMPRPSQSTEVLRGVVVDADSGRAIAGATVTTVAVTPARGSSSARASDAGEFQVAVSAGAHVVRAAAKGYLSGSFGARFAGDLGQPVSSGPGPTAFLTIRLWRTATIAGRLRNEQDDPIVRAAVRALRTDSSGFASAADIAATATSDDRGEYRLGGLSPGTYLVAFEDALPATVGSQFETRFYPGTLIRAAAVAVPLAAGQTVTDIDVHVAASPRFRVSGQLVPPADVPRSQRATGVHRHVDLFVAPIDESGVPAFRVMASDSGAFDFPEVTPGDYVLRTVILPGQTTNGDGGASVQTRGTVLVPSYGAPLAPSPAEPTLWGEETVHVEGRDLVGLHVSLRVGARVSGHVLFAPTRNAAPGTEQWTSIPVALQASTGPDPGGPLARVEMDGSFRSVGLPPSRYHLWIPPVPAVAGWAVDSMVVDGKQSVGQAIELGDHDLSGLTVTLTDELTELRGLVHDASGRVRSDASVFVFPVDQSRWAAGWRSSLSVEVRLGPDGSFIARIPVPGIYFAAATIPVAPNSARNPAFLSRLAPTAQRVTLSRASAQSVALVCACWPPPSRGGLNRR